MFGLSRARGKTKIARSNVNFDVARRLCTSSIRESNVIFEKSLKAGDGFFFTFLSVPCKRYIYIYVSTHRNTRILRDDSFDFNSFRSSSLFRTFYGERGSVIRII